MTNVRENLSNRIHASIRKNNKQFSSSNTVSVNLMKGKQMFKEKRTKKFYLSVRSQILCHMKKVDVVSTFVETRTRSRKENK